MIAIRYPEPAFRYKDVAGKRHIFDPLRRRWLMLTPEEWVRQNFVQYLVQVLGYPPALLALEKEIRLNDLFKRFDLLVYDKNHQPWMLVECKAPEVALSPAVLDQALRYHITVPVNFIVITNGNQTMGWEKMDGQFLDLNGLPGWPLP
jgi:hypothetical protein